MTSPDLVHAVTAGDQDHSNPDLYRGAPADAPTNPTPDELAADETPDAGHGPTVAHLVSSWHVAGALLALRDGINARWPNRSKASDGTIGDAAHATRDSDHNPWLNNTVRAIDVTAVGVDAAWIVEELRKLGAAGDRRLRAAGYVIYNGRITNADWSGWHVYTGSNKHLKHFHVSGSTDPAGYEDRSPWPFLLAPGTSTGPAVPVQAPTPAPPAVPACPGLPPWTLPPGHYYGLITGPARSHGGINAAERANVQALQRRLIARGYVPGVTDWRSGWADGRFEEPTRAAVVRFQRAEMPGTTLPGQVWADDWRQLGR